MVKQNGAFLTIGELAAELNVPHHILRYWETRFPMLKPLQRAGNRRYYRPEDVDLVRRIHHLLNVEGYTVKGAQQALLSGPAGGNGRVAVASDSRVEGEALHDDDASDEGVFGGVEEIDTLPAAGQKDGGVDRDMLIKRIAAVQSKLRQALDDPS